MSKKRSRSRLKNRETDFTAGGIHIQPDHPRGSTGDNETDACLRRISAEFAEDPRKQDLVTSLMTTSVQIGRDNLPMADLKLIYRAMREMRHASRVFAPYRRVRKVTVFGSARTPDDHPASVIARQFSERMVQEGFMVITGGGNGIMGASQAGAGRDSSFGLNIKLPFEQSANATIEGDPKLITFNYFFTRKLSFVKEADAFAMFPGGYGTMDELFESITLMQTGKANLLPIVLVDEPGGEYWKNFLSFIQEHLMAFGYISPEDTGLFLVTDNVDVAVQEILHFYQVFHSYRHVREQTVFRLNQRLTEGALEKINTEFSYLLESGKFEIGPALPEEVNEPSIAHMSRLRAHLKRANYGHWRKLINAINDSEVEPN